MASDSTLVSRRRQEEVDGVLAVIRRWAAERLDLRAVALVGSWARGAARPDSDVDVVLLTEDQATYLQDVAWLAAFGATGVVRTRQWGAVTERRVVLASGLELEFGVTGPGWASTDPVDAGTRVVVCDGLVVLHDPEGLLAQLIDAVATEP